MSALSDRISVGAEPVVGSPNDYDALMEMVGEARFVLLGEAVSIGFTTYTGSVTAASDWDAPAERKQVRPGHRNSYEALFHDVDTPRFFLNLRDNAELAAQLRTEHLERAIGVIYRPETEMQSHYFHARLPDQFDGVLHFDHTRAVEPLERTTEWQLGEVKETFPSGL